MWVGHRPACLKRDPPKKSADIACVGHRPGAASYRYPRPVNLPGIADAADLGAGFIGDRAARAEIDPIMSRVNRARVGHRSRAARHPYAVAEVVAVAVTVAVDVAFGVAADRGAGLVSDRAAPC